ncbi:cholinephosphotransferase 1 [Leucoraja erinacea]|uniref:cholinephosphotransferase 1 n=1 Tax=Leucoraja erinaceus TaxID=7782 RepID=UPI002456F91D|nr:cholinephosphotransferase 1 [Leucoraja erinacea]
MGTRLLRPLSEAQLKRLEDHRYRAAGRSLFEPALQLYWCWLLNLVPAWLAPNAITLLGLATNLLSTLLLVYHCPGGTEQAPGYVYMLCGLGLFIYQSLDALDGKQARRTNTCSPLGELFDHGCDSFSTVVVGLGTCLATRLGTDSDLMFFSCFIGLFLFYCAHWQTYVSGSLRFAKVDVTEVQICIMLIFFLSAIGGATLWDNVIPVLGIRMKILPVFGIIAGAIYSCINYFQVIFTGGMGKNGSTIAGTSVLSPALHIGLVIVMATMIYKKSTTHLFEEHPCLYVLAFGCVASKVTNKLVVAHITKSKMKLQDTAFIGPALLFFNQYFNSFINEYYVLWVAMILSLCDLLLYCTTVCIQIAAHLRIEVLRIPLQAAEQKQSHNE